MFDVIYCELAKLRRSYFFLLILGVICFFPVTLFIGWLGMGQHIEWNNYLLQIEQINVMFINLSLFAITAAYIFTREYTGNTAQALFTYPASRTKIFAAKYLVVTVISSVAILLEVLLVFAFGLLLPHDPLTVDILLGHLRINCFMLIYVNALLPLAVLISILCRNIILPIVCTGLATVLNMMALGIRNIKSLEAVHQFLPTIYTFDILSNSFRGDGTNKGIIIVKSGVYLYGAPNFIAAAIFIVGILLCLYFYNKADID